MTAAVRTAVLLALLLALALLLLLGRPSCAEVQSAQLCGCWARLTGLVLHYGCADGGYIELRGYVCASQDGVKTRLEGGGTCLLIPALG